MEITLKLARFAPVVPLVILMACASAPPTVRSSGNDAAEVEAFFRSGIEAFNRHELDLFTSQFADDIAMYTPTGWVRGRDAVRARFDDTFKQFPDVRMEVEDLSARSVGPDTVVTEFRWRVYPRGQGPAFHGVGSGVYVRRNGVWQEVLEHETVTRVDEALAQRPVTP